MCSRRKGESMADAPKNAPTEEQVQQAVELLRQWRDAVVLPESEHWKLWIWELQNPAIVAAAKAAREEE